MPSKVIHIGFPKTGSTFLQKEIFPTLKNFNYIPFDTCVRLFQDVIYLDDLDYNHDKSKEAISALGSNEISMFSQEALSGAPFTFKGLNRSKIPERLYKLGFNKVIITIRNQNDMIDSLYRQYIYQGGVMRFKDFLNLDGKWNHYIRAFNLDYLKYDKLIALYQTYFGKENVLVLPHELLQKNESEFLSILCSYIGADELDEVKRKKSNESISNLSTGLIRLINHFTFNSQRPNQLLSNRISTKTIKKGFQVILDPYFLKFFSRKKSLLSDSDKSRLTVYYQNSNRELNKLVDFNLEDFGYPI